MPGKTRAHADGGERHGVSVRPAPLALGLMPGISGIYGINESAEAPNRYGIKALEPAPESTIRASSTG